MDALRFKGTIFTCKDWRVPLASGIQCILVGPPTEIHYDIDVDNDEDYDDNDYKDEDNADNEYNNKDFQGNLMVRQWTGGCLTKL